MKIWNLSIEVGAFFIAQGTPKRARTLAISIQLESQFTKIHRDLLPLFFQIANLISGSVQADLARQYGLYSTSTEGIHKPRSFKVAHGAEIYAKDILDSSVSTVSELYRRKGFERFIDDLGHASYRDKERHLPTVESVFRDTGMLVGAKG